MKLKILRNTVAGKKDVYEGQVLIVPAQLNKSEADYLVGINKAAYVVEKPESELKAVETELKKFTVEKLRDMLTAKEIEFDTKATKDILIKIVLENVALFEEE